MQSPFEEKILALINAHRATLGKPALAFHEKIQTEAQLHTKRMAAGEIAVGHDGFQTRASALLKALNGQGAAENVAYGQTTPEQAVKNWLDSAGHRQNLEGDYNLTGISVMPDAQGRNVMTQLFILAKAVDNKPVAPLEGGELAAQVLEQINAYRQQKGLAALQPNPDLQQRATEHSRQMASGAIPFGHDGFQQRAGQLLAKLGGTGIAENVAFGQPSAAKIVASWLGSEGHRKNIEGAYALSGVGVASNAKGEWFFTQIFVK